jgi:hypothetical protein
LHLLDEGMVADEKREPARHALRQRGRRASPTGAITPTLSPAPAPSSRTSTIDTVRRRTSTNTRSIIGKCLRTLRISPDGGALARLGSGENESVVRGDDAVRIA